MMNTSLTRQLQHFILALAWLLPAGQLLAVPAFAGCPAGTVELRPNIRALAPREIAMLDATNIKFSTTSWNSGDGKLTLVPRAPTTDPTTGQPKQPVDQRIYCSDGSYYDRPAGSAEYHSEHNHIHYNDYANYILEPTSGTQNPRQGAKTTFCIMDTSNVNTQLKSASASAFYSWCPTQDPNFNTQGMSVGWGDRYGADLPGQNLAVGDLMDGTYRLRNVFDPKTRLLEAKEDDNESCRLIELGTGSNGRYVADRGPCTTPPAALINSITPAAAKQTSCVAMTIFGANLAPELRVMFVGGTGPLPMAKDTRFDVAGNFIQATVCVPKVKGGKNPLGSDPVWDVLLSGSYGDATPVTKVNLFRVTL